MQHSRVNGTLSSPHCMASLRSVFASEAAEVVKTEGGESGLGTGVIMVVDVAAVGLPGHVRTIPDSKVCILSA